MIRGHKIIIRLHDILYIKSPFARYNYSFARIIKIHFHEIIRLHGIFMNPFARYNNLFARYTYSFAGDNNPFARDDI